MAMPAPPARLTVRSRKCPRSSAGCPFTTSRWGQRAAIVFAGPFINYLFAILVLATLFATAGQQYTPPVLGGVVPGGAAAQGGLKAGDRIVSFNGTKIDRFEEVLQIAALRPGETMPIVVLRGGRKIAFKVKPKPRFLNRSQTEGQGIGDLGVTYMIQPIIGKVLAGTAAAKARLLAGDRFIRVNGKPVKTFEEVRQQVLPSPGKPLRVEVRRGKTVISVTITPEAHQIKDKSGKVVRTVGLLGVRAKSRPKRTYGPLTAILKAVEETYTLTVTTGVAIGQMISGTRSTRDLGGPLRIAEMSGDMAQIGLYAFVWFLGALSLHLCLINLLPVPLLDGGHLLFYGIEAVRGKPLGDRAQEFGFRIGLALVLTLMIFATWNDLLHFRIFDFLKF